MFPSEWTHNFGFLEIFQKSPGGSSKPLDDSYVLQCSLGFLWGIAYWRNRTTTRRKRRNLDFSFLMNGLAVMNTRQATRVKLTQFWCFKVFGMILIGRKGSSNCLWMIRCYTSLNYVCLEVKLDEIVWTLI